MKAMRMPIETKPVLWGAVGGAVVLGLIGFNWGGWVTGGKAESSAVLRANAAVVVALAPICVDKFRHADDTTTHLAALRKLDSWLQGDYVEKGGWATLPGANPPDQVSAVAKACAVLLTGA